MTKITKNIEQCNNNFFYPGMGKIQSDLKIKTTLKSTLIQTTLL